MHDEMHGDVHLAEREADRIHQEGHVRRHYAHQCAMRGFGRCTVQPRRKIDEDLAALAPCAEFEMRERRGCEVGGPMGTEILLGDAAEEAVYEFRPRACVSKRGDLRPRARLSFR